ncbi:MAG: SMP-30/gluconolactonase/LRE family protein [Thermoproteota archaeon]
MDVSAITSFAIASFILAALITSPTSISPTYAQEQYDDNITRSYSLAKTIGSNRAGLGEFNGPAGLTTDSLGNLYVVDSGNKRVQKFSGNGTFLAMWNISDAEPHSLTGIDVDSSGNNVYVTDFQNGLIWKLSGSNTISFKQFNLEPYNKSLRSPFDIAIDPDTNEVYVTAGSDGIRKYAVNGTLISQFNENYKNDNRVELHHTTGADIDSNGNIYVLTADNPLVSANFVQVFSGNGTFLGSWGGEPLKHPNDIAIDSSGTVYIRDTDSKIKVFAKNGTFLKEWGSSVPEIEIDQLTGSVGIAFDPNDDNIVYLSDSKNNLVKMYTKDGQYISSIGLASSADGQFDDPQDIEFDSYGNMYVADLQNHRIQKFAPDGAFVTKWGSFCETKARNDEMQLCRDPDGPEGRLDYGDGQFSSPVDIAIDSNDSIYVLDGPDNMRIQKFTSDGKFITKFNINAENKTSELGAYVRIVGIVVDSQDNVYVGVGDAFPSIQKFSSNGTFIKGWNLRVPKTVPPPLPEDLQYLGNTSLEEYLQNRTAEPWRIAIDASDNIYVTAVVNTLWENYHIEKMSSNGTHLATWGKAGWCKEEFREIRDMAFDSSDNLYLVDVSNDRISKFANNGTFQTLLYPEDIGIKDAQIAVMAFDATDKLYLAVGNTISIFEPDVKSLNPISPKSYYQVPLKLGEGTLTSVSISAEDAKVVCGSIDSIEKVARFELLTDNIHDDLSRPNAIEVILPDEYIYGIYQVTSDSGETIQFQKEQLDNKENASLFETLDLSSGRDYTIVMFVAPEKASFVDIYATTVIPEFSAIIIPVMLASAIGVIISYNRFRK